jgi:hypothetical protein
VRNARVYCAGVVLGASLVAGVWLYTYRAWETKLIRGQHGLVVVDQVELRVHPWWAVLGAYSLPLIGAGASVWLLPEGRRLIERIIARLGAALSARPTSMTSKRRT